MSLSQIQPQEWEKLLATNLWNVIKDYAIETIYFPSAQTVNPSQFKTKVDILLKQWAERSLPSHAVQVN